MTSSTSAKPPRGSRAGCLRLTEGSREDVARRLTRISGGKAIVTINDDWAPFGPSDPKEARLCSSARFIKDDNNREALRSWWLKLPRGNTPNWDIVSTATIDGRDGLLLVEAKGHEAELGKDKNTATSENAGHIVKAIASARDSLNTVKAGWRIAADNHYQLSNRFAWAWKIAQLKKPVVLVYLGIRGATGLRSGCRLIEDDKHWRKVVEDYCVDVIPAKTWDGEIDVGGTPIYPVLATWSEATPETFPAP